VDEKKGIVVIANIIEVITRGRALEKYSDRNRLLKEAVAYVGQPQQNLKT